MRVPRGESRIRRTVRYRQFVIGLCFIHGFNCRFQIGPRVQRNLPDLILWQ